MSGARASDVQRAVRFLTGPDSAGLERLPLPPRPDYDALARHAAELGHELPPDALREAFRLIMRARLVAAPRLSGREP